MNNAHIHTTANGYTFLNFFNSKDVYYVKGFDTKRKALNYAKKYSVTLFEKMPEHVCAHSICQ